MSKAAAQRMPRDLKPEFGPTSVPMPCFVWISVQNPGRLALFSDSSQAHNAAIYLQEAKQNKASTPNALDPSRINLPRWLFGHQGGKVVYDGLISLALVAEPPAA